MYMQAEHVLDTDEGDPTYTLGGYYDDELEHVGDRWLIRSVTLNVLWRRGNPHIMQRATELGRERLGR